MLSAMKYHFRHLTDFSGRDARQTFWYWFLFLFIVNIGVSMVATVPMMMEAMALGMQAARDGNAAAVEALMTERMAGRMGTVIAVSLVLGAINLALMAASFTRRVHDSGNSGVWVALTGVIYLGSLVLTWARADEVMDMMRQLSAAQDPAAVMAMQGQMAWEGLLGYVPLIIMVVFGVMKSESGPNKYGAEPVRF